MSGIRTAPRSCFYRYLGYESFIVESQIEFIRTGASYWRDRVIGPAAHVASASPQWVSLFLCAHQLVMEGLSGADKR